MNDNQIKSWVREIQELDKRRHDDHYVHNKIGIILRKISQFDKPLADQLWEQYQNK